MSVRSNYLLIVIFLFLVSITSVNAKENEEEESNIKLKKELTTRINISQISFTNWAKGGDNTITYNSGLTAGLTKDHPKYSWFLLGDVSFGQIKQGDKGIRNTIDRIDLDVSATFKKNKFLNPFLLFTLDTQFAKGFDYKKDPPLAKSDFWDPAYLIQSMGTGVQFNKSIQTKIGFALKETFTNKYRNYSDDLKTKERKEWFKIEPGINSRTDFNYAFNGRVKVISKLEIFSNLTMFKRTDVRWDSKLQGKIARYFSVNLNVYLLYDYDDLKKAQIKQFLGVGFVYHFF